MSSKAFKFLCVFFFAPAIGLWCILAYAGSCTSELKEEKANTVIQLPPKKIERFTVQGNLYVNEAIDVLQGNGWTVTSIKPMSEPQGVFGLYDVLITYE